MYSVLSRLLIAHRQLMKVWDLGPVRQLATQITAEHPWIPCPRSTKQDQIISVSAVSATHYIFHCFTDVCAGTDVFLWSFLFSTFQGASRTKTCSLWVLQRDRWSCPGCIPCEGGHGVQLSNPENLMGYSTLPTVCFQIRYVFKSN